MYIMLNKSNPYMIYYMSVCWFTLKMRLISWARSNLLL